LGLSRQLGADRHQQIRYAGALSRSRLFQGQYFTNNAILLAAANMATFPLLIAFLFFQKQLVEGVALSGLK
jgi:ABC-type glycerol-3-phosphate transport system permease component